MIIATLAVDLDQGVLIADAEADLARFLERSLRRGNMSYGYLVNRVKDTVANFVFKRAQLRPMILPVVTEF